MHLVRSRSRTVLPLALVLVGGCTGAARPVPAPAAPAPAPVEATAPAPAYVWTRDPGVALRGDSGAVVLPYLATRLEVVRDDSAGLLVRCSVCPEPAVGLVARDSVVVPHPGRTPAQAAEGGLAEFVLAVREAALRRDLPALRAVMSPRFVHDVNGRDGPVETLAWWEAERYRSLDHLPRLLDRGVAALGDAPVWAAPPEFVQGYGGLRAGFRQVRGRWEWAFLVQDGRP